jgi:uncharacterized repeat protein (TIGR01451 family)
MKKAMLLSLIVCVTTVFILGIFVFAPWGERHLGAVTSAGVILTNIVQVNWNSGSIGLSTNATNVSAAVGTNYGMTWIGMTNQEVVSGYNTSNETYLTNDGNATADFILSFNSNVSANASSTVWAIAFTNVTSGGASSDTLRVTLSPAGGVNVRLLVNVPGNETNGAFVLFQCLASNSNASAEIGANATNYVGFNGTAYGGNMGKYGAGAGNAFLTNADADFTNWAVTVVFADIQLSKTAEISNADPFAANTTDPFPGALITYKLQFTNRGNADGSSVKIIDSIPTNYLTYTLGSIKKGPYGSAFSTYGSLSGLSDTEGDDDGSSNSAAADQLVFCPTNGTAPATGGVVNKADGGTYFYRTYLK